MAYISFQPSDYFNTLLYTGTGSSNAVTGVGFRPDFVWIKGRNFSDNHNLYDIVRGVEKRITSNGSGVQEDRPAGLTAFGSDGFTVNTANGENKSSAPIVAWNWRAGNAQGSSNTDGSINTTYTSVNTTSGFSISQYTGTASTATVGHGLGVTPSVVLTKNLSADSNWQMYHIGLTSNNYRIALDSTDAEGGDSTAWNNTSPTSTVFSVGTSFRTNGSGNNIIAYAFAEKKGFSKFGSYKGNGSTWGPFINCGFLPAFVLWKRTDSANGWIMMDNKRPTVNSISYGSNPQNYLIEAQSSGAEATDTSYHVNFLSNGFKIRNTNNVFNNTSGSYIYLAFADHPLVSSNGVAATAN
tara:strand:- start:260 stop:1321 length:1062 start_codon:yes stop_codon:yes gene_type:complete